MFRCDIAGSRAEDFTPVGMAAVRAASGACGPTHATARSPVGSVAGPFAALLTSRAGVGDASCRYAVGEGDRARAGESSSDRPSLFMDPAQVSQGSGEYKLVVECQYLGVRCGHCPERIRSSLDAVVLKRNRMYIAAGLTMTCSIVYLLSKMGSGSPGAPEVQHPRGGRHGQTPQSAGRQRTSPCGRRRLAF